MKPKEYIIPEGYTDQETAEPAGLLDFSNSSPRIITDTSGAAVGRLGEPIDEIFGGGSPFFSSQNPAQSSALSAACFERAKAEKSAGHFGDKTIGELSTLFYYQEMKRANAEASQQSQQPEPVQPAVAKSERRVRGKLAMVPSTDHSNGSVMSEITVKSVRNPDRSSSPKKKVTKKKVAKKKPVKKKVSKKVSRFSGSETPSDSGSAIADAIKAATANLDITGLSLERPTEPEITIEIQSEEANGSLSIDEFPVDWALLSPAGTGRQLILVIDTRRGQLKTADFTMRPDRTMLVTLTDHAEGERHSFNLLQAIYSFEFGIFQFVTMFEVGKNAN